MKLSFFEFIRLGSHQWYAQKNPLGRAFLRWFGPLGTHARIRNARILNSLPPLDLNGKRVLDIGSGHGYALFHLAQRFPQARLTGIELDRVQVEACRRTVQAFGLQDRLEFIQGTFADVPAGVQYDLAITIDVLEHVPDDEGMLRKMAAALCPGGQLVVHVPLRHQLQRRFLPVFSQHTVDDHVRDEYLPEEIQAKVEATGLCVSRVGSSFGPLGELSFELNNLFWRQPALRALAALLTLPVTLPLGFWDARAALKTGNAIVLNAYKPEGASSDA